MEELENYNEYSECTAKSDWKGICELNGVVREFKSFVGIKKELRVLPNYLEDGEVVFAITTGVMRQTQTSNASDRGINTWLVVLTNERFLFLDHAFLTKSVDTQSVRHDSIQAVSASQGFIFGKIQVDLGARVIVIDDCLKATVSKIAELANKWIRLLQQKSKQHVVAGASSGADELEKFAKLKEQGILSEEEFQAKKKEILGL